MSRYATTVTKPVYENVPPGDYILRLLDVGDGPTFVSKAGKPEPTVKLQLEVAQGPQKGMRLSQLLNLASWGPKANATRWAAALTGHDLEEGETFDPEAHIDQTVWARVIEAPDGQGIPRNRVDIVMSRAALEAQFAGTTAAPRPVGLQAPAGGMPPKAAPAPGADRELELPDEAWDGLEPPPADEGP